MTVASPGTRILVVDDHVTFAELLANALDREPDLTSVGHATTAAAGVSMFRELRPELVLMDLELPDATGLEATSQIMQPMTSQKVPKATGFAIAVRIGNEKATANTTWSWKKTKK